MSETKIRYMSIHNRVFVFDIGLTPEEAKAVYAGLRAKCPPALPYDGPYLVTVLRTESLSGFVLSLIFPGEEKARRFAIDRSPYLEMATGGKLYE